MDCSVPGSPVLHCLLEFTQIQVIESVMPFNHLILCHPLLLLTSVFPTIRFFSNELALCIRWPKYWSFSFSTSPSNEYLELISFRIDRFDLLVMVRKAQRHCGDYLEEAACDICNPQLSVKKLLLEVSPENAKASSSIYHILFFFIVWPHLCLRGHPV